MKEKYQDKEWLREKYVKEGLFGTEIAKICGVHCTTIYKWLRKFDIEVHHRGPRSNHIKLTDELCDFLDGLLLDDGCLYSPRKVSAEFRYTSAYKEYLKYLSSKLHHLGLKGVEKYVVLVTITNLLLKAIRSSETCTRNGIQMGLREYLKTSS